MMAYGFVQKCYARLIDVAVAVFNWGITRTRGGVAGEQNDITERRGFRSYYWTVWFMTDLLELNIVIRSWRK
jgi:hypothetical protein